MSEPAQNKNQELTVGKAARLLGISPSTLRRYEDDGLIQSRRADNGYRKFSKSEVLELKAQLEKKAEEERAQERQARLKAQQVQESKVVTQIAEIKKAFAETKTNDTHQDVSPTHTAPSFLAVYAAATAAGLAILFMIGLLMLPYPIRSTLYKNAETKAAQIAQNQGFKNITNALALAQKQLFATSPLASSHLLGLKGNSKEKEDSAQNSPHKKSANLAAVLGRRTQIPDFELEINVPTSIAETLSVEGLSTLSGGIQTTTINATEITTTTTNTENLNLVGAIDDTTKITLEETLELTGDVEGTLDNTTIAQMGGADIGEIDDDDGNILYIDDSEIISGTLADLDTTDITELGTISTGVWQGTTLDEAYGGTGLTSYTTGDIIYASTSNTLNQLNIGTAGYVLTSSGGLPAWTDIASATTSIIGDRIYTEDNFVTDEQTVTASIDALDQAVYANASGETGLWRVSDDSTYIYPNTFPTFAVMDTDRVGIGTTSPSATFEVNGDMVLGTSGDTITFTGGVKSGTALAPAVDLGADLGAEDYRFNNIYVANINNNSQLTSTGQAIFTYIPGTLEGSDATSWTEASVRINPTEAPADSWLFGLGIAGSEVAGIYHDGGAWFDGSVGIGVSSPTAKLQVMDTSEQLRLAYDASNYTSFTIDSSGELTISDSGEDVAVLGATQATFNVPTTFNSAGDVSIANDLIFTNQTSANIQSYGPLYIESGENFENNDLTLKTYGTGNVALDLSGTGYLHLQATDPSIVFDTATATDTDFWMGVIEDAGGDDDDIFSIGDGYTPGSNSFLTIDTNGYVGIGTTNPSEELEVAGNILTSGTIGNSTLTISTSNITSTEGIDFDLGDNAAAYSFDIRDSDDANLFSIDSNGGITSSGTSATFSLDNGASDAFTITNSGTGHSFRVNDVSSDTSPFVIDDEGNVGIGHTTPSTMLHVLGTTEQLRLGYDASNYTSFTIDSAGQLTIADTGTDIATFGAAQASFDVPLAVNSAGDISAANDLNFTNTTASYITSDAPLYIQAGNAAEAESLYLSSAGSGDVYVDDDLYVTGDVLAADGSASAPSLSFEGDSDTGLFSAATNTELGFAVGGSERMRVDASGYLGIGTTNPSYALDVTGTAGFSSTIYAANIGADTDNSVVILNSSGLLKTDEIDPDVWTAGTLLDGNGTANYLPYYSDADTLAISNVYYDGSSIGVGTTTPVSLLDVAGTAWLRGDSGDNGLYVEAGGNVGIGTTAPSDTLSIAGGTLIGSTYASIGTTAPSNGLLVEGNVGIGTTNPGSKLSIAGIGESTGTALLIDANGDVWKDSSSARYKENFEDKTIDTSLLLGLEPVEFDYKQTGAHSFGYIAEELDAMGLTDLLVYDNEGRPDAIRYDKFSVYLVEAFKEQHALLEDLEARFDQDGPGFELSESDILGQIEQVFTEFKEFVAALGLSVDEETQTLVAESDFTVLGDTTLADTTITGDLSVGLLQIDSLENSIGIKGPSCVSNRELCQTQTLYLQKNLAGNVDFFDGKIVLNPEGNVMVAGTLSAEGLRAKKFEVETAESGVAGASAGKAVISAGQTSVEVNVDAGVLTADSMIMVTPRVPVAVGSRVVSLAEDLEEAAEPEGAEAGAEGVVENPEDPTDTENEEETLPDPLTEGSENDQTPEESSLEDGSAQKNPQSTFEIILENALNEDLTISWWIVN